MSDVTNGYFHIFPAQQSEKLEYRCTEITNVKKRIRRRLFPYLRLILHASLLTILVTIN